MKASEVAEAIRVLETELPKDIEGALRRAAREETGLAAEVLGIILKNVECAREEKIPMCQDTGSLIFFLRSNRCSAKHLEAIREGVRIATESVPLRPNTVHPFTRENEGSNLGRGNPVVHFEPDPSCEGTLRLGIMAKGAGSENVGKTLMLEPDLGVAGVREAVLKAVAEAGGRPCPPIILGVGIGGTSDQAALLSKKALMRRLDEKTADPDARDLEADLLTRVNGLGIGPMGFGGKHTALGVRVELAHCHTASLPVGVSIGCWALRRVTAEWEDGKFVVTR